MFPRSSYDPSGQSEGMGKTDQGRPVQTRRGTTTERRTARRRPDKGLHKLSATPLQEAQLQEPSQHLSSLCHTPPLKHSVRTTVVIICFFTSQYSGPSILRPPMGPCNSGLILQVVFK